MQTTTTTPTPPVWLTADEARGWELGYDAAVRTALADAWDQGWAALSREYALAGMDLPAPARTPNPHRST